METNKSLNEYYVAYKTCGYLEHYLYLLDRKLKTLEPVLSMYDYKPMFLERNYDNLFYKASSLTNEEYEKYTTEFITENELLALEEPKYPMVVQNNQGENVVVTNDTMLLSCYGVKVLPYPMFFIQKDGDDYNLVNIENRYGKISNIAEGTSCFGENAYYLFEDLNYQEAVDFIANCTTFGEAIKKDTYGEVLKKTL